MIWDWLIPTVSSLPVGVGVAMLAIRLFVPKRKKEPTGRKLRRLQATARRVEARRVRRLPPVEAMLDYKAKRRKEEAAMWMERFRELVPAPGPYDYLGMRKEEYLFSGQANLIRRAFDLPADVKVSNTPNEPSRQVGGHVYTNAGDYTVVRNAAGDVVVRIPRSP